MCKDKVQEVETLKDRKRNQVSTPSHPIQYVPEGIT